jgi:hypothetical protein
VVIVFTRDLPKTASLLQKLDEAVDRYRKAGLKSFAVVLSEDFAKEDRQKDVIASLQKTAAELKNVVLAVMGPAGPDKYNLNKDAEVTVLVYKKLQVVANFAYAKGAFNDTAADEILAAAAKVASGR